MKSRIWLRGVRVDDALDMEKIEVIDVGPDCALSISDAGSVVIGLGPSPDPQDENKQIFDTQRTYPAWRVIEVETTPS